MIQTNQLYCKTYLRLLYLNFILTDLRCYDVNTSKTPVYGFYYLFHQFENFGICAKKYELALKLLLFETSDRWLKCVFTIFI